MSSCELEQTKGCPRIAGPLFHNQQQYSLHSQLPTYHLRITTHSISQYAPNVLHAPVARPNGVADSEPAASIVLDQV
jgi:hypothetical protein